MDKKRLHHKLTRLERIPYWGLFIAGVLLLFVSVFALRANNQTMIELRQAVFTADEQDGDVEKALTDLREYVYSHMNTSLTSGDNAIRPPIQLKYRYERLVIAEQAKQNTDNETIYTDAQNFCEQQISTGFSGRNRLECIKTYIDTNGIKTTEVNIPDDLYKFDFISPSWSPDLAGFSLLASIICFMLFAVASISKLIIKRELKSHHH